MAAAGDEAATGDAMDADAAIDSGAGDTGLDAAALDAGFSDAPASPDVAAACPQAALLLDVAHGQGAGGSYAKPTLTGACTDTTFTATSNSMPFYTYVAMTPNGRVFDSSLYRGAPYDFRIGAGQVWRERERK